MSMSGSKIREQVAHFLVDIHRMEYLADNTMMKKAYRLLKSIRDVTPGV